MMTAEDWLRIRQDPRNAGTRKAAIPVHAPPLKKNDVLQAMPEGGLQWGRLSVLTLPPFPIEPKLVAELQKLGQLAACFLWKAANDLLPQCEGEGAAVDWPASGWGKPAELLRRLGEAKRNQLPGVIRLTDPDANPGLP
jgi:hypothetical protein